MVHSFPTRRSSDLPPPVAERIRRDVEHPHHQRAIGRSEEHTSELQSHHPISYAVFCLKKKIVRPCRSAFDRRLRLRSSGATSCASSTTTPGHGCSASAIHGRWDASLF